MGRGHPADETLRRLLHVLPAAARQGGVRLSNVAEELGVAPERVLRDIEEVTARAFYHRSGQADRLQIALERDRVSVWTAGEFRRPVKLSPREALALHLALRAAGAGPSAGDADPRGPGQEPRGDAREPGEDAPRMGGRPAGRALARRLERELAVAPVEEADDIALEAEAADRRSRRILSVLFRAARRERLCRIRYLSSGARSPSDRTLAPYSMIHSRGRWYALSREEASGEMRLFRADRVLDAELLEGAFEVPERFDPREHVTGAFPYDEAEGAVEATVRYSWRIAPWIREKWDVREVEGEGGAVEVTHSVSDPSWLVRHVLQYGPDAEVRDPPSLRRRVAEAAREVAGS